MSMGRVTSPNNAFKIGKILAAGGEIPAELARTMRPFTFTELSHQAQLLSELQEMNVPGNKLGSVLAAAEHGGLENAFPGDVGRSFNQRRLDIEERRTEIEIARYNKLVEIAAKADSKMKSKELSDAQKQEVEQAKELVMMAKQGKIKISPDVVHAAERKIARSLGLEPEEVNTLFGFKRDDPMGWHTGTRTEYKPITKPLTKDDSDIIDEVTGAGRGEDVPPEVGQYLRGIQP